MGYLRAQAADQRFISHEVGKGSLYSLMLQGRCYILLCMRAVAHKRGAGFRWHADKRTVQQEAHKTGTCGVWLGQRMLGKTGRILLADPGRDAIQPVVCEIESRGFHPSTDVVNECFVVDFARRR
jgi:hypothetical protein